MSHRQNDWKLPNLMKKNIKAKISHWSCADNFLLLLKWMILKQKFYCKDAGHFCLIVAFVTRRHIHKFATGLTHHLDAYRSTTVQANPPIWMILLFSFKIVSFESPKFGLLQIKITDWASEKSAANKAYLMSFKKLQMLSESPVKRFFV